MKKLSKEEARVILDKHAFIKPQEKRDRAQGRMRDARAKHLYINPHSPIPNAAERIAEAIKQAEQTQRNIDALDKGETA
jgi:hypothetical protein